MLATFTKLENGFILDTFASNYNNNIITRYYIPVIDEDGDFEAPIGKNIIIDKRPAPSKNIYKISEAIEKTHNEILKKITS